MVHFESQDDDLYQLTMYPVLLYFAKVILIDSIYHFSVKSLNLWSLKYIATFVKIVADIKEQHANKFNEIQENGKLFSAILY